MFSSSQFDAMSSFADGGFTSSQLPDSTPSPVRSRDSEGGVVPVTVKQINEGSPAGNDKSSFFINGVEVTNVSLVGMVTDKVEKVTDVAFRLDDGTGSINCRRWVNEAFDTKEMEIIQDGMYVRIIGHLKRFQDATQVAIFSARPVKNFDEITFHFIDCIHFHLQKSKLQLAGSAIKSEKVDSSQTTPVRTVSNGTHASPSHQVSMQFSVDGLKDLDQLVLEYLKQSSSAGLDKGTHRDEICQHLRLPAEKLIDCIKSLEDEGLIYSTIDDFHLKAT